MLKEKITKKLTSLMRQLEDITPEFTTPNGESYQMPDTLIKILDDVIEQAFIPLVSEHISDHIVSNLEDISLEDLEILRESFMISLQSLIGKEVFTVNESNKTYNSFKIVGVNMEDGESITLINDYGLSVKLPFTSDDENALIEDGYVKDETLFTDIKSIN